MDSSGRSYNDLLEELVETKQELLSSRIVMGDLLEKILGIVKWANAWRNYLAVLPADAGYQFKSIMDGVAGLLDVLEKGREDDTNTIREETVH